MTNKEKFINLVRELFEENQVEDEGILKYFNELQAVKESRKAAFTAGGLSALEFLQNNTDKDGYKAKEIAEGLDVSSRSVSGWCRKLETDGYIEKIAENPAVYTITEKGKNVDIDVEKENIENA